VPYGAIPTIYIDSQPVQNQGYTQDTYNYYVWYTTHFSTHQVTIQFAAASKSPSKISNQTAYAILTYSALAIVIALAITTSIITLTKKRKTAFTETQSKPVIRTFNASGEPPLKATPPTSKQEITSNPEGYKTQEKKKIYCTICGKEIDQGEWQEHLRKYVQAR
jgi:hypothetical protein